MPLEDSRKVRIILVLEWSNPLQNGALLGAYSTYSFESAYCGLADIAHECNGLKHCICEFTYDTLRLSRVLHDQILALSWSDPHQRVRVEILAIARWNEVESQRVKVVSHLGTCNLLLKETLDSLHSHHCQGLLLDLNYFVTFHEPSFRHLHIAMLAT